MGDLAEEIFDLLSLLHRLSLQSKTTWNLLNSVLGQSMGLQLDGDLEIPQLLLKTDIN